MEPIKMEAAFSFRFLFTARQNWLSQQSPASIAYQLPNDLEIIVQSSRENSPVEQRKIEFWSPVEFLVHCIGKYRIQCSFDKLNTFVKDKNQIWCFPDVLSGLLKRLSIFPVSDCLDRRPFRTNIQDGYYGISMVIIIIIYKYVYI